MDIYDSTYGANPIPACLAVLWLALRIFLVLGFAVFLGGLIGYYTEKLIAKIMGAKNAEKASLVMLALLGAFSVISAKGRRKR
jgi:uncharacterized membrane protein YraQ (UPF0718 family)